MILLVFVLCAGSYYAAWLVFGGLKNQKLRLVTAAIFGTIVSKVIVAGSTAVMLSYAFH